MSPRLQGLDMGLLQVFAFSVLGKSEETVGEGVGLDVGKENLKAF